MAEGADRVVHPVTPERWSDLETLFGPNGAVSGCWCVWWRVTAREWEENGNAGNRAAMQELVARGRQPGLIGYRDGRPTGWVSVAPREEFGRIERSRNLGRVDATPVWSIVCFWIPRQERRSGLSRALLEAACAYAAERGARTVEAYPIDVDGRKRSSNDLYTGVLSTFLDAGFVEVARRAPSRPIVRREVAPGP